MCNHQIVTLRISVISAFSVFSDFSLLYQPVDRNDSPLCIDTTNVPVALHLTSQWHQSKKKKRDFKDFYWYYADFSDFFQKSQDYVILMGLF